MNDEELFIDIAGDMARGLFQQQVYFEIRRGNLARLDIEDLITRLRTNIVVAQMKGIYLIAYEVQVLGSQFSWLRADVGSNGGHVSTYAAIRRRIQAFYALASVWEASVAEQYPTLVYSNIYALESFAKHFSSILLEIPDL